MRSLQVLIVCMHFCGVDFVLAKTVFSSQKLKQISIYCLCEYLDFINIWSLLCRKSCCSSSFVFQSVELDRLALYLDSDIAPWHVNKQWDDLLPSEWVQVYPINPLYFGDPCNKCAHRYSIIRTQYFLFGYKHVYYFGTSGF